MFSANDARQMIASANLDQILVPILNQIKARVEENVKRIPSNRLANSITYDLNQASLDHRHVTLDDLRILLRSLGYSVQTETSSRGASYLLTITW